MSHRAQIAIRFPLPPGATPTRALIDDLMRRWIAGQPIAPARVRVTAWIGRPTRADLGRDRWGVTAVLKRSTRARETFADYDRPRPPSAIFLWAIARIVAIRPIWMRYDRTRRGWHVIILWSRRLTASQTVALQAVLGSDPIREALNLMRVLRKPRSRDWNLLFEKKLT